MKSKDILILEKRLDKIDQKLIDFDRTVIILKSDLSRMTDQSEEFEEQRKGFNSDMKRIMTEALMVLGDRNLCEHKPEWVESEFNEDEQFAYCTHCDKSLTEEYSTELESKYIEQEDQLPFKND